MDLKDPKKQKIILSSVFVIGLLYAYFVYDYAPKARDINLREVHLASLKSHISNARARVEKSDEEKMKQELHALEAELERIEKMLPLEEEVPYLLEDVERRGLQSGVSSVLFEPRGETHSGLYTEHFYRVSVRGGYHNIGLFLSRVSGMKRIISPSELSLVTNKEKEETIDPYAVVAEFDMNTYTSNRTQISEASE
ncbi:MAG: type 4a pilus biogenesis protein PilO [Candidatus Glassbacteria bacterium]